ncbi:MAG: asparagine synthase (glutamine-hydrolyzing) [Balneolaceae bacterium]|nr:MAG: asparagine synthase (glutamine-hydrolyzing) [Balneolaceae bacterium]
MCGIAGFINHNGKEADGAIVKQMLQRLYHRGPDHQQSWVFQNIAMGYTRLKILDLTEQGNQPFVTEDGKGILFYNGEVYNFRELRKELEHKGGQFKSKCDTEVVLSALKILGPVTAVQLFNGMFAFAYYDLNRKELWLGRDRTGIKPLYYTKSNGITAFASEIKALFGHPAIPTRPDLHALTSFILEKRLNRITPFDDVQEIKPGTLVRIRNEHFEEIVYFDLSRDIDVNRIVEGGLINGDFLLNNLEELLSGCVESHLQSDAPLAFMTSGGVDSSLITAIAKDYRPNIQAYVADVKGEEENEVGRAKIACEHIGVNLKTVPIDLDDYLRLWPKVIYHNDEPLYFRQSIMHMAVAEAVKKDGYKVLLCGEGADELFGGYFWYEKVHRTWLMRDKRLAYLKYIKPYHGILKKLTYLESLFNFDALLNNPFFDPFSKDFLENRNIAAIGGGITKIRQKVIFKKLSEKLSNADSAFIARSIEDFELHLGTSIKMNDKMNMAFSIESRVPFLDNRLIDFGIHLPVKAKYDNGVLKSLLKKSAEKKLPHTLIHQKKIGFHVSKGMYNFSTNLLNGGCMEHWFKWRVNEKKNILAQIESDNFLKFQLMSAELWGRIFFNNEQSENLTEKLYM